jgi:hypothetical protein
MVCRSLRSRTVEPSQDDLETPVGEKPSGSEGLGSVEGIEILDSLGQPSELPEPPLSELEQQPQENVSQPNLQPPSTSETSELKHMFAGLMAVIQQNSKKLQECVKADLTSVKADLAANNENLQQFKECQGRFSS